jgi:hypothetical protein
MRQIKTFSDQRLDEMCSYCGGIPETADHVPSRILLDNPFPDNLPVVPCCEKCNQDFSLDEEYFACAIECILHGTTNLDKLQREKIKSILSKKLQLKERIENSFVFQGDEILYKIEEGRFRKVVTKLAKGHAKYENSEPQFEEPLSIVMKPLISMTIDETANFFSSQKVNKLPEVGSRALQNILIDLENNVHTHWTTVQENNYKYSVTNDFGQLIVRIVIWNYLGVEVIWE